MCNSVNQKSMKLAGTWVCLVLAGYVLPLKATEIQNPFPFSSTPLPSLGKLAGGFVEGDRVKSQGNQLSMAVETFYLVPKSPAETLKQLQNPHQFDAGESSENFGIDSRARISLPADASDFKAFDLVSKKSRFGFGGSPMLELKEDQLNLSKGELKTLKQAAESGAEALQKAWVDLFLDRTRSFKKGGIVAIPPYESGGSAFHHQAELVNFLRSTPKVLKEFQSLMGNLMTGDLEGADKAPVFSWESSKVQGDQTVSLACMIASSNGRGGYRAAEVSYYVTGKYYTALVLYDLVPMQFEGKEHTLIWRGDYVITSSIGFLKGIERVAAENIMLQEVKNSIRMFIQAAKS